MCGGGGSRIEQPDPMQQAQAQIQLMAEEARIRREDEARARELEMLREQELRQEFNDTLSSNRNAAFDNVRQTFQQRGLDPMSYEERIQRALDLEQQGMNFTTGVNTFDKDFGTRLLDDLRNERVREFQQNINSFAPEGFETQAFGSTADDAILDAILGDQFSQASDAILRSRDRGVLNDAGFRYAMDNLNTQKSAAGSRLQDIGGGILEDYRGQLRGIADNARTGAGNFDFGSTFDPSIYGSKIETRRNELSGGLEGDIRNAIGGEQFFDIASLIQKGGVGQGATNTGLGARSGGLLAAFGQRKNNEEQLRGLGTRGAF